MFEEHRLRRSAPRTEYCGCDAGATYRDHDGSTMVVEGVAQAPVSELSLWRHRWARLVSLCPDAFVEVDGGGVVTEWNPRAEEMFGWRRDEVVGRSMADTLLPPDLGRLTLRSSRHRGRDVPGGGGLAVPVIDHRSSWCTGPATGSLSKACCSTSAGGRSDQWPGSSSLPSSTAEVAATGADSCDPQTGLPDRVQFDRWLTGAAARAGGSPAPRRGAVGPRPVQGHQQQHGSRRRRQGARLGGPSPASGRRERSAHRQVRWR